MGASINDVRILGGGGGPRNSDIFGHGGEGGQGNWDVRISV